MSTIKDVARTAGVSIATVSNYLNATKPVAPATARKIDQAIELLQYTTNTAARNLRTRKSHEIGVILPNFDDPYYVQLFQGIEKAFSNSLYFLNIAFSYDSAEQEQRCADAFLSKQICGLILVSCQPNAGSYYRENFLDKGIPIVMVDRRIEALDANFVLVDNYFAVRRITAELLAQDKRQLHLFSGSADFSCEASCIRAFADAYRHAGIALPPNCHIQLPLTKEQGFSRTISLLKQTHPEVILTTSSLLASGVIEALHLLGYPPEDIPVITLSEEHWNQYTQTQASHATSRPAIKLGNTAAQLLLGQLNNPDKASEHIVLEDTSRRPAPVFEKLELPHDTKSEPLRILMLNNPTVHTFEGLIKNFENLTGIPTQISYLSHNAIFDEIQNHASRYDVLMFDIPWLSMLAQTGVLEDLSEDVSRFDTAQFFPNCLSYFGEYQNRTYGIPFITAPQMLYYRRDLFEDPVLQTEFHRLTGSSLRPPLSLNEYNTIAEFFTCSTDAVPYGAGVAAAYNECFAPELYFRLHSFQSRLFGTNGTVTFDNPQTRKAYENFRQTLRFANPNFLQATDVGTVEDFLRGDTAMLITFPACLPNDTHLHQNSAIIAQTLVPGRRPLLGGWSFGISRGTSNRQQALAFLRWTCDETISNYFTLMGGQTAIASTYTNDEMVKLFPWLQQYYKAYPYAEPQYQPAYAHGYPLPVRQMDDILCKWAYRWLLENADMADAITATHRELEQLIAK